MNAIKSIVAGLASAAAIGVILAPTASADATSDLLKACKITDNESVQELAIDLTLDEGDVFDMINDFRAEHGVEPLEFDREVTRAAVVATHDAVLQGGSPEDHVDSLGRDPGARLDDCGVPWQSWSENNYTSYGTEVSQTGAEAFEFWANSDSGHREAMLDPSYTKVGLALGYNGEIGQVQDWNRASWTVVFTS
jgi:uncharacterized protein YkwD